MAAQRDARRAPRPASPVDERPHRRCPLGAANEARRVAATAAGPRSGTGRRASRRAPGRTSTTPVGLERDEVPVAARRARSVPTETARGGRVPMPAGMSTTRLAANTSTCTPVRGPRRRAAAPAHRTAGRRLKRGPAPDRTRLRQQRGRRRRRCVGASARPAAGTRASASTRDRAATVGQASHRATRGCESQARHAPRPSGTASSSRAAAAAQADHGHRSRQERGQRDQHEAVQERRDQHAAGPERADRDQEAGEEPGRCRRARHSPHATKARITASSTMLKDRRRSGGRGAGRPGRRSRRRRARRSRAPRATTSSSRARRTRHAASTHASSTTIGQNHTIDGLSACHSPPAIARRGGRRPASGTFQRPDERRPRRQRHGGQRVQPPVVPLVGVPAADAVPARRRARGQVRRRRLGERRLVQVVHLGVVVDLHPGGREAQVRARRGSRAPPPWPAAGRAATSADRRR